MKRIVISLCMLLGMYAYAQDFEVPTEVLTAFESKYPEAEDLEWKLRNDTYQAEFLDINQCIAVFSADGTWMKTISLVTEDDLPETAYAYIDETYEISNVIQVQMIEDNKYTISYKVMVLEGGAKVSLKFNEDGEIIK